MSWSPDEVHPNFSFKYNSNAFEPWQQPLVQQFFDDVTDSLPNSLKKHLAFEVQVAFERLTEEALTPTCNDPDVQGKHWAEVRGRNIKLHSALIPMILNGRQSLGIPCPHKTYYQFAKSRLVHEVAHIYDKENIEHDKDYPLPDQGFAKTISTRRQFLELAGWTETGALIATRSYRNRKHLTPSGRSPDPYESHNREEALAVNMEFFLLDPSYKCRRPSLYNYFRDHFDHTPFPNSSCQVNYKARLQFTPADHFIDLDPKNIYEIHFMHASEGKALISGFGHSMFRIVLCNTKRHPIPSEKCLNDLDSHVVLSFGGEVPGVNFNMLDGLLGRYNNRPFLFRFGKILEEYSRDEGRNLVSLPIEVAPSEKQSFIRRFIERVLELNWEYEGPYELFANNCATESYNLLRAIFPSHEALQTTYPSSISTIPSSLYKHLATLDLVDPSKLDDLPEARRKQLFYDSMNPGRIKHLKTLKPYAGEMTVDEYIYEVDRKALFQQMKELFAQDLEQIEQQGHSRLIALKHWKKMLNAFIALERHAHYWALRQLRLSIGAQVVKDERIRDIVNRLSKIVTRPQIKQKTHYGIPTAHEMESAHYVSNLQGRMQESEELQEEINKWQQETFGHEFEYIAELAELRKELAAERKKTTAAIRKITGVSEQQKRIEEILKNKQLDRRQ